MDSYVMIYSKALNPYLIQPHSPDRCLKKQNYMEETSVEILVNKKSEHANNDVFMCVK